MELDHLFLLHYAGLVEFGRRKARGLGDAEDFVHEAYLRSRRRWSDVRRSSICPESYFYRSLKWVIADARRRSRKAITPVECMAAAPTPEQLAIVRDSFESGLAPAERSLFTSLMAGRSAKGICRELRISSGALAVRICRARRKLVRLLDPGS
jgi:DNA-directed RNA polymerase specialized sigma24 family protein